MEQPQHVIKETYLNSQVTKPQLIYDVKIGTSHPTLPTNVIHTNKYTILNFLPLSLFEQFRKSANIYFLIIAVLQSLPEVSITKEIPAILTPLTLVVILSAMKDLFEDLRKYFSDKEENKSITTKIVKNELKISEWGHLRSGDIIRINNNEKIPADCVCLYSSNRAKKCSFVETKSLDGETNLKVKLQIPVEGQFDENNMTDYLQKVREYTIRFEKENSTLNKFIGELDHESMNGTAISLKLEHLLLRGCVLKNTEFIYAVVIYAGHNSKIMQNSIQSKLKKSKLDRETNAWIKYIFLIQLAFCSFSSIYYISSLYYRRDVMKNFIVFGKMNYVLYFFIRMGNWILIFRSIKKQFRPNFADSYSGNNQTFSGFGIESEKIHAY